MPISLSSRCGAALVLLVGFISHGGIASAQTIPAQSQTPPGAAVERQTNDAVIELRVGGVTSVPAGADNVQIKIAEFRVEGGFAPVSEQISTLLPAPGSQISLADLYTLAASVQQKYADAGYPLVRVFVPVQELDKSNARVHLQVVSGYVSEVRTEALNARVRAVVAGYLVPLIGKQNLTSDALERAVLLAGDVSGVELSSALSPGTETGETILIVSGRFRQVEAGLSFDNRLAPELGREQATLSVAFNNTLGLGERIGVTLASALDVPSLAPSALRRYGGLFVDLPVGNNGLVLGADAALSSARPRGAVAFLALDNQFEHFGGRVSYPLVRSRKHRLVAFGGFDANRETQASLLLGFPVPLSRDLTRVARIGLNGLIRSRGGLFAAGEIEYSRGVDILGARRANDASVLEPLSRIGADSVFDKLTGQATLEADVPGAPLLACLTVRGQTGFGTPLLRSEQISVTSPDLISGPPSGVLVGDSGLGGRLQTEAAINAGALRITPHGFGAMAWTWLEQPTPFERGETHIEAFGGGVSAQTLLGPFLVTGVVEYSHTNSNDRDLAGDWMTFQIALKF